MDSEDDDEGSEASGEKPKAEEEEVTLVALDNVQSFGRMMLLTDSLLSKLKSNTLSTDEIAAACRALARSRFFDGDILEKLSEVLKTSISGEKFSVEQVTDVLTCLKELNYCDKHTLQAIAKVYRSKIILLTPAIRNQWLECMQFLGHRNDLDFMQTLEVPPLLPTHVNYKRVRCKFFAAGKCESGDACTYAHSLSAPLSLDDAGAKEDNWRKRSVLMTHEQMYVFKERDTWSQTMGPQQQQQVRNEQAQQFMRQMASQMGRMAGQMVAQSQANQASGSESFGPNW